MKIKCLIIDDEPLAIDVIKKYIEPINDFEVVGSCESAIDGFNFLSENQVDLMFLDINMPSLSGIDFLKSLQNPPIVIITTAYREYAIESFDLDVLDYLVKPIPFQRFMQAVNKVKRRIRAKQAVAVENTSVKEEKETTDYTPSKEAYMFFKVDKKMVKVYLNEILYIESLKDYIRIKTVYEELITHQTLTGISETLPSENFMRIHRSFTIAIDKVKAIEGNCVEISGKLLPIGRNYIQETKERIYKSGIGG